MGVILKFCLSQCVQMHACLYVFVCGFVDARIHKHAHLELGNGQTIECIYTTLSSVIVFVRHFEH